MEFYITILLLFCTTICLTHAFDYNQLQITFDKTLDNGVFLSIYGKSLEECLDAFTYRPKCKSVNYKRHIQLCQLNNQFISDSIVNNGPFLSEHSLGFVYIENPSWQNDQVKCGEENCINNEVCNQKLQKCEIKECDIPLPPINGYILGNMVTLDSRIVIGCNQGSILSTGHATVTSQCIGGRWSVNPPDCIPSSCKVIAESGVGLVSGIYKYYDTVKQKLFDIFCDFYDGYGYTYIPKDSLSHVSDLSNHYTRTDHVVIRHIKSTKVQREATVRVLPTFQGRYNITVLLSSFNDFTRPKLNNYIPYMYLGLIPISDGPTKNTIQGYTSERVDYPFTNCDGNSNNYFAVFANANSLPEMTLGCYCSRTALGWVTSSRDIDETRLLPENAFFCLYEIHMGGCGAFMTNDNSQGIEGATFGLRFDFKTTLVDS